MSYASFAAVLAVLWIGLAVVNRRRVMVAILNAVGLTQVIGCALMEAGSPAFDFPEFGYPNHGTVWLLASLIGFNVLVSWLPVGARRTPVADPGAPVESTDLLFLTVVGMGAAVAVLTVLAGAPLLQGGSDFARVSLVKGQGPINYLRAFVLPVMACVCWYRLRSQTGPAVVLRRILIVGSLLLNAVLMASKSAVLAMPLGIFLVELTYAVQAWRPAGTTRRTVLWTTALLVLSVLYMISIRTLHAGGELTFGEAAANLGLRIFLGQGNVFWKIATEPGALRDISGDVWMNIVRVPGLLPRPHDFEFYYAVTARYTTPEFAEFWNLVSSFAGEPVMLYGPAALVVYVPLLAGVLSVLHLGLLTALNRQRSSLLAVVVFYFFVLLNYWQMGGLYTLVSVQNLLVALSMVLLLEVLRAVAGAWARLRAVNLPAGEASTSAAQAG